MFDVGWSEFLLIALVILVFVGPKQLPEMMRKLGRMLSEIKSAGRDLRNQIEVESFEIDSPSKIVRDMVDSVSSPYDEVRKAEEEAKREFAKSALTDKPDDSSGKGES